MARGVVEEMSFVKKFIGQAGYEELLQNFSADTGLAFSFEENRKLKRRKIADSNWQRSEIYHYIKPLIDPYNRFKSELVNHKLKPFEIYETDNDDLIVVKVQSPQGLLSFYVPIKRITSSSGYVFTFWMILTAAITSIISIIFLKNQTRTISQLSEAAEKFGRGQDSFKIKPSGSNEIRSLTISFLKMKERVARQISQRTDMLSGVSHDLRTPLTRMKLQLELMPQSNEVEDLKTDISDMEKMVDEYLEFARTDDKEKTNSTAIKEFLQEKIINYYSKMNRKIRNFIEIPDNFTAAIKKLALKRALVNLIDNAFNHGEKVELHAFISDNNLIIEIDDDGPGIPKSERKNVLKPFYRIDNSRNLDKKSSSIGSGLGLAIATDAITSHGGHIKLASSPLGGLKVLIYIPI